MSSTEYRANVRDMKFILHEMLNIGETVLKRESFKEFGVDDINMILSEAAKFAETVLGPASKEGDREGCRFDKGKVMSTRFFVHNILPQVFSLADGILSGDRSALEIAEEAF
jgi:hypothetical protein